MDPPIQQDYDRLLKVLVIGDAGVGKTSLITRYFDNMFSEAYVSTVGIDFKHKIANLNNIRVKLQL